MYVIIVLLDISALTTRTYGIHQNNFKIKNMISKHVFMVLWMYMLLHKYEYKIAFALI